MTSRHPGDVPEDLRPSRPVDPVRTPLAQLRAWLAERTSVERSSDPAGDDVVVTGVSLSSRRVAPGDLYAALPGARTHGADFVADAVAAGAVAVLTDPAGAARLSVSEPVLVVDDPRAVLGGLAAHVHGEPARSMAMIGVTGTQGKTTTTRLLEGGLTEAGVPAAVVGTLGTRIAGTEVPTALTTPEAPDLHGLFAAMRERGVRACAMEVSSHALVLGRVDGVVFDVATFLNLGRDHLDFHADLEDYFAAKATLFTSERARRGLACVDDEHGRRLLGEAGVPMSAYSATGRDADFVAVDVELGGAGSRFVLRGPDGLSVPAQVPVPGAFNVANAVAAIASAALAGLDPEAVARGIAMAPGVPGRLEQVSGGEVSVVVDYAHKPDAIEAVLGTLRPLTDGRLIVVLGAGGERDPGKRPIMGEVAARLADVVVVTDDNPRGEDPALIRAAVLEGVRRGPAEHVEVGDRRLAVREALARARPGDVVLVAGKGHEAGQEVAGVVHPFDDRVVAREEMERVGLA